MTPLMHKILDVAEQSYQRYKNHFSDIELQEKLDKECYLIGEGVELSPEDDPRKSPINLGGHSFFSVLDNHDLSLHFLEFLQTLKTLSDAIRLKILNAFHKSLTEIDKVKETKVLEFDAVLFSDLFTDKLISIFGYDQPSHSAASMKRS
jgi:hypothetical protein